MAMFKSRNKKTATVKLDHELYETETNNENAEQIGKSEATSLRDEIAKIKSKGKPKAIPSMVSFDEEHNDNDSFSQKKPLYNAELANNAAEDLKEREKQPPIDSKKYNTDYLDELKKMNQKQSESAREMMYNVKTLTDLGHEEEEILEPTEAEQVQMDIENDDDEEGYMDPSQLKKIQDAKDWREKKRRQNAGDFISLNKDNQDNGLDTGYDKQGLIMSILKDKPKEDKNLKQEIESESDDEFTQMENKIIQMNVNKKKMKNINSFVQKTYRPDQEPEQRERGEMKMLTHEVDLDYVMRCVGESLKNDEAHFEDNIERLHKVKGLLMVSEDNIINYQREYGQNAGGLSNYQDVMDYMNDITDCLADKKNEIDEAVAILEQLEDNYSTLRFLRYKLDVSDQLEENGGAPLDFENENLNHKRNTEKNFRLTRRLQNQLPLQADGKIEYILRGITEDLGKQRADEDISHLKNDKTALYLAAKDIFKDVIEEYTSKDIIISRFYDLKEKYVADEAKVLEWTSEALAPFAAIDMIGYDPLGYTDAEFDLHGKVEFAEIPFFKEMNNVLESYKDNNQKEIQDRHAFVEKLITELLGKAVKSRLKEIIDQIWDPFSVEETKQIAAALHLFIAAYYNPNKLEKHLESVKELVISVASKLKEYFSLIVFPPNVDTRAGYDMFISSINLLKNTVVFKGILPLSNILQIGLNNIFFFRIFDAIKSLQAHEQLIIISEIIKFIPEAILHHADLKSHMDSLKAHLRHLIPETSSQSAAYNQTAKDSEMVKESILYFHNTLDIN